MLTSSSRMTWAHVAASLQNDYVGAELVTAAAAGQCPMDLLVPETGVTALHLACRAGHAETGRCLVTASERTPCILTNFKRLNVSGFPGEACFHRDDPSAAHAPGIAL